MPRQKKSEETKTLVADAIDPTTDEALLALSASYAEAPDMPVDTAKAEFSALARMAKAEAPAFAKVGINAVTIETMARFGRRLGVLETAWKSARAGVKLTAAERKQLTEAEALDGKLLAGGRWGCRKDEEAQKELSRIAEGSGLVDTVQDLKDLVVFWGLHAAEQKFTNVTAADLKRATELAGLLGPAAEKEGTDLAAAEALDLRNRCFWAADEAAREMREGGRYAFAHQPKVASKFVSRYRTRAVNRARKKAKAEEKAKKKAPPTPPTGAVPQVA